MTGNERSVGEAGMVSRAMWIVFFWRRLGLDFVFMIILPLPAPAGSSAPHLSERRDELVALRFVMAVEFPRKPPNGPGRLYDQSLRAGDFILESIAVRFHLVNSEAAPTINRIPILPKTMQELGTCVSAVRRGILRATLPQTARARPARLTRADESAPA